MTTRIATFLKTDPDALKGLLARYERGRDIFTYIQKTMKRHEITDAKMLAKAKKKFPKLGYTADPQGRAKNRIIDMEELLGGYLNKKGIRYYLDIGVGDGSIVSKMADMYGKISCYGIDIKDERVYRSGYVFKEYDGRTIPFEGLDLVTLMMVLHHVRDLDEFMKSLAHSADRYVIIRDHDVETEKEKELIRIQHDLFDMLYTKNVIYTGDQHFNLLSMKKIKDLMQEYGFEHVTDKVKKNDPTKAFYSLFKKKDVV